MYLPDENLKIEWHASGRNFNLSTSWGSMEIDVEPEHEAWIRDASNNLKTNPANRNVQRFLRQLKEYPVFYTKPRTLRAFKGKDLQESPPIAVDCTTPQTFIATFDCALPESLRQDMLPAWTWDWEKILQKAQISGTDLYDPVSFVTYLICYRLEKESTSWVGEDKFGKYLEGLLHQDESRFFENIGWVSRQSWYVTMESGKAIAPALTTFKPAAKWIDHFLKDEAGHYKFMEMVFDDIGLDKEFFPVDDATRWMVAAHGHTAYISPLAFSALINLFEAAYYEGVDPLSRVILMSSKPHAARGYDLHYKINQEHRHCDMPVRLAAFAAPQPRAHAMLTLGLFELILNFLDKAEQKLATRESLRIPA